MAGGSLPFAAGLAVGAALGAATAAVAAWAAAGRKRGRRRWRWRSHPVVEPWLLAEEHTPAPPAPPAPGFRLVLCVRAAVPPAASVGLVPPGHPLVALAAEAGLRRLEGKDPARWFGHDGEPERPEDALLLEVMRAVAARAGVVPLEEVAGLPPEQLCIEPAAAIELWDTGLGQPNVTPLLDAARRLGQAWAARHAAALRAEHAEHERCC